MIFHSDWSTGLGTSDNVVLDTGKAVPWDVTGGAGFEVIPATGLGFPSANCLRVTCLSNTQGFCLIRKQSLTVPGVGQSRYYRWYNRIVIADDLAVSDRETHPHQDGNSAADSNWLLHVFHDTSTAGRWLPSFVTEADIFDGPQLQKNVTYRFEFRVTRTATSSLTMDVRIYDSSNNLLHDGNSFPGFRVSRINSGSHAVNVANTLGQFNAGLNGLGGGDWGSSVVYMYQGAVAIGDTDWLGPYGGGI